VKVGFLGSFNFLSLYSNMAAAAPALTKAEKKALDDRWEAAYKILTKQKNVGFAEFAAAIEGLGPEYIVKVKKGGAGKSFLDKAIDMRAVRIAQLLISKGAPVNVRAPEGREVWGGTPLEKAVGKDSLELVQMLLAAGADPNNGYRSPLTMCASATKNGVAIATMLLQAGADINLVRMGHSPRLISAITAAIQNSNYKVFNLLLSQGATLAPDSILYIQANTGGINICKKLIEMGLDVNVIRAAADTYSMEGNILHFLLQMWMNSRDAKVTGTFKELLSILTTAGVNWNAGRLSDGAPPFVALVQRGARWVFRHSVSEGAKELFTYLLTLGVNINAADSKGYTALHWAATCSEPDCLNELIRLGANVNSLAEGDGNPGVGYSPINSAIAAKSMNCLAALCAVPGVDVNTVNTKGSTLLMTQPAAILKLLLTAPGVDVNKIGAHGAALHQVRDPECVPLLVAAGADINLREARGLSPLYYASGLGREAVVRAMIAVPTLDKEAIFGRETIYDIAKRNGFNKVPEINAVLVALLKKPEPMWEGWTSNDLGKFDTVFDESANEFSCCPVCLKYVGRDDGCMYMRGHNCSSYRGDYYHKELYTKYKSPDGHIYWCTICGRISLGHRHYELSAVHGPKPALMRGGGDPFSNDCSKTEGGGGRLEKVSRFRRLREYALELQEQVGTKTFDAAMNELVEEMWNAPLARKGIVAKINATKKWNINASVFPAPPPPPPEPVIDFASFPDVLQAPQMAEDLKPTVLKGLDAISQEPDSDVIQFHHVQPDGGIYNHENNYIGAESLEYLVGQQCASWKTPAFGHCWETQQCKGRLWPEEIRPYVSAEVYADYKAKFNWRFRAGAVGGRRRGRQTKRGKKQRGGYPQNVFKVATNAQCSLPRNTRKNNNSNGDY